MNVTLSSGISGPEQENTLLPDGASIASVATTIDAQADEQGHVENAEACLSDVGDFVWEDSNTNGIQDAGEKGVAYTKVSLLGAGADGVFGSADDTIRVTATDANGKYLFTDVADGVYKVQFDVPSQYRVTKANVGDSSTDSDVRAPNLIVNGSFETSGPLSTPSSFGWTGEGDFIEVGPGVVYGVTGQTGTSILELEASPGTRGSGVAQSVQTEAGQKYELSLDAAMRLSENKLFGGIVEVYWNGVKVGSIDPTSAVLTPYSFTVTGTGGNDKLELLQPADVTSDGLGGIIDNVSLTSLDTAESAVFNVACQDDLSIDAGLIADPSVDNRPASLGDFVWEDKNTNGIQDAGERGIVGAQVELVRDLDGNGQIGSGEVLATTVTDANGHYRFDGLTAGLQYQVRFLQPEGYLAASPRQADSAAGSNANSDGVLSDVVTPAAGEYNDTLDAGFIPKACAKLVGTTGMNENTIGTYSVTLDRALDYDVTFTIQTGDITANRVDFRAHNQEIMWGNYYTANGGSRYVDPTEGYIPRGQSLADGYVKSFSSGKGDNWDYSLYTADGTAIATGGTMQVTIKAGQTSSEDFYTWAWSERVHVDRNAGNTAGYYEGTEQFSLSITGTTDSNLNICKPSVTTDIYDTSTYHLFSPIALDLDGNGIQTTAIGQTQGKFDLLGNGTDVTSGWLSSGSSRFFRKHRQNARLTTQFHPA